MAAYKYTENKRKEIVEKVISNLKLGIPISKTLKDNKVTRISFYNFITEEQKKAIEYEKALTKVGLQFKNHSNLSTHNIFLTDEEL